MGRGVDLPPDDPGGHRPPRFGRRAGPGRVLHGLAREDGDYMAPPDIEAGTAPVETSSEGTVVVDADLLFMGPGAAALARRAGVRRR